MKKLLSSLVKLIRLKHIFIFCLIVLAYLFYLRHQIISKFEYHRWNLPSRIYSDSFPLYNGASLEASTLKTKLDILGYRFTDQVPSSHGSYSQIGNQFTIYLHRFPYPNDNFEGKLISFTLDNQRLNNLYDLTNHKKLTQTKLEPELISSVFDQKMENRTFVPLSKIPDDLIHSVVSVEDERFYSHFGVDPMGIARAFVKNLLSGRIVQGGSTLTQQLVKNYFLHSKKSYVRKINEIFMAILMEIRYSKDEILESYFNEIYLGQQGAISIAGVQEAARYYFSKDVDQLTLAQSALLAGLIRSPGYYSPFTHLKRALERRNLVLQKLFENKFITEKELIQAKASQPSFTRKKLQNSTAAYFIQYVQRQLEENFPQDKLKAEGLNIFTTLEMSWQRKAEKSLRSHLDKLETQRSYLQKKAQNNQHLEGAFVALQPQTGYIRAYVGGRNYSKVQLDHLSQIQRQPGSAFKPFVYLSAIDPQITQTPYTLVSKLEDSPLKMKSGGETWSPQNYDKQYHGLVSLRTALEKSYNVSAVKLAMDIGLDKVISTAQKAGITTRLQPFPSIALGSFEVSPLELAAAYSAFPNQGVTTQPIAILKVVTPDGDVLEKKEMNMQRVFSADAAFIMNKLMQGVITSGTGQSARSLESLSAVAGKTGTTTDYRDAWFVGYSPELVGLSWVGFDNNDKTNLSGASGALPIWSDFMAFALKGSRYQDFLATDANIIVSIDIQTGLLAHKKCGPYIEEYFIEGTEPQKDCRQ